MKMGIIIIFHFIIEYDKISIIYYKKDKIESNL